MLIEIIEEPVKVRADFSAGEITPRLFRYGERVRKVEKVNARWTDRSEDGLRFGFSVNSGSEVYELSYRPDESLWRLEKVMLEG